MAEMERLSFKRRKKLINRRFQFRSIATWLTVVLAGFLVCAAGLALSSWISYARGDALAQETVIRRLEILLPPLLANDLLIMLIAIVAGIFTTHRVAGPIYRMESDIDRVLSGETHARVRLRRGDAFPELAEKVNELIERLDDSRKG
jgi:methyl-accepting chemotaxis protein